MTDFQSALAKIRVLNSYKLHNYILLKKPGSASKALIGNRTLLFVHIPFWCKIVSNNSFLTEVIINILYDVGQESTKCCMKT